MVCDALEGGKDAWKGARLWCAGGSAWICWNANVTAYDETKRMLTFDENMAKNWYRPRQGNPFVLRGLRRCLDAPGEWFYDTAARRLLLIPPDSTETATIAL